TASISSSAPRLRSAPLVGSTTWSRMWSSITSVIRLESAPRAATMRCSTLAQPFSSSSARSTAPIWPPTRLIRLRSFSFSRLVWDTVDSSYRVGGMVYRRDRGVEEQYLWHWPPDGTLESDWYSDTAWAALQRRGSVDRANCDGGQIG